MARKAIYKHATQVNASSYPDDGSSPVGTNEWNEAPDQAGMYGNTPTTATVTIASGVLTVTDSVTVAAAEAGTSDTLDKLAITNTNEYDLIYLFADTGDTITLTNTSSPSADGHIKTISGANETLSVTKPTILMRKGNYWYGYGGGSSTFTPTSTDTLTNKTIDQDGTGNSITNIANASIKASAAIAQSKIANLTTDLSGKSPTAGSSSIDTTGALDSGSITSGFGNINIGSSTITTSGAVTTGAITAPSISGSSGSTTGNAATVTTNANLTGEVTSSGNATTIADNMVDEANLKVSNAPTNAYVLTARSGNTGGMTWEAASAGGATIVHEFTNTQTTTYTGTASSFSTVGVGTRDLYIKKIDANNEGVFTKIWKNGSAVEVQIA